MAEEALAIDQLFRLPISLERFKLFRANQLESLRRRHRLPSCFRIKGSPWPCTPPVIERLPDQRLIVIDGAHRVYAAYSRGESKITAIVVDNPRYNVPARPSFGWEGIKISTSKLPRDQRYQELVSDQFRLIRSALADLTI
jgi:hypothetical protein